MNITSKHVPFAKLTDLAESLLPSEESATLRAHISACSQCAAQFSRLEQIIALMRTDNSEDAPPDVVTRAASVFRQRVPTDGSSFLQRIVAALSFDSMQLAPSFGIRSGQQAARQLLYSAGEKDIDLRITSRGEKWVVSGQVLGECSGGRVELEGATDAAKAAMNDLCEFTLPPVSTGSYTLRLFLNDMEVEVPDLNLRA